jgi:nicotinate-nucleotide adenylyltransferase
VRLGLLGGTFDPPHVGHLLAASDAFESLELDRLVYIPAAQQPLKRAEASAAIAHRLRMLELMTLGDPRFTVDDIEARRPGLSYTVDTLEEYARRLPGSQRFLLLGADAYAMLDQWREPARVAELARLVVLTRDTGEGGPATSRPDDSASALRTARGAATARPLFLRTRRVDVSSTEIRERVRSGRPVRGFVTDAVAQYIENNGLYRIEG